MDFFFCGCIIVAMLKRHAVDESERNVYGKGQENNDDFICWENIYIFIALFFTLFSLLRQLHAVECAIKDEVKQIQGIF